MEILSVVGDPLHQDWGVEILSISAGEYEHCAPEWFSLTIIDPPHPVAREELIGAYNLEPDSVRIKCNSIILPHLLCYTLDVL